MVFEVCHIYIFGSLVWFKNSMCCISLVVRLRLTYLSSDLDYLGALMLCVFGRDGVDVVGIFEFQCLVRTMILYNLSILHL